MTTKKYWRVLALSLVLVTLLTLCSCSASREARPTNRANKVVATVGAQLTFNKGAKAIQWKKDSLLLNLQSWDN